MALSQSVFPFPCILLKTHWITRSEGRDLGPSPPIWFRRGRGDKQWGDGRRGIEMEPVPHGQTSCLGLGFPMHRKDVFWAVKEGFQIAHWWHPRDSLTFSTRLKWVGVFYSSVVVLLIGLIKAPFLFFIFYLTFIKLGKLVKNKFLFTMKATE